MSYPYFPFQDSLFGESLLKAVLERGFTEEKVRSILEARFPCSGGYVFTKNSVKELIMNSLPDEIRRNIRIRNSDRLVALLLALGRGELEHQETCGLDILMEILEWILTGYEDPSLFPKILEGLLPELFQDTFLHPSELADRIRFYYDQNLPR